jgi:TonB family protein
MQIVPMGLFPTYCFNPDNPMLRAYFAFGQTQVIYNRPVLMQGMFLAREILISEGRHKVLTATVDTIDGIAPTAPELTPRGDIEGASDFKRIVVSSGVATGQLLAPIRPIYPVSAKQAHVQGTVVLKALIGTDGHIHDLSVISGPSPDLIAAAINCVSHAEYRPYRLKGELVEVETTINMIFRLGR